MNNKFKIIILAVLLVPVIANGQIKDADNSIIQNRQWPSYRGYYSSGILDSANIPQTWNVKKMENLKWKIEIPGLGLSSPVVWGDCVFITTAIGKKEKNSLKTGIYGDIESIDDNSEHQWKVYCVNKNTGSIIWEKTSCVGVPIIKRHSKSSHANCSVATDGKHVVAFFGSEGIYCYSMNGDLLWSKNFGKLKSTFYMVETAEWEFASSPIIYNNVVIVQCDVLENSFVEALNAETGAVIWKKNRDELPGWCTPNIYLNNGKARVVLNGFKQRGAYDFETGDEIWKMSGGGDIPIPTPLIGDSLIYFNSAHGEGAPILAIKKTASGDISLKDDKATNEYVKWSLPWAGAYMQTMLLYGEYLYNCNWNGTINCYNAGNGKLIYKEKLGKSNSFTGCPVASDGKISFPSDDGKVYVFQAGPTFKLLSTNELNDICMTTPAITDNIIFFRTKKYLIAIA